MLQFKLIVKKHLTWVKDNVVVPSGQVSDERTEDRCSKALNIEQQNKEPQNDEVNTSIFPPEADSIFCGSKRR